MKEDRIILVQPRSNLVYTGSVTSSEAIAELPKAQKSQAGRFYIRGEGDQMEVHLLDWLADYVDKLELIDWEKEQATMNLDNYQELAEETAGAGMEELYSPMQRVACDFHIDVDRVLCAALGAAGEAGELANKIKKLVYHNHHLEHPEIREEIGDVLWYLAELCNSFGWSMSEVAEENIEKLRERYPDGFKVEDSINR